jgi:NADH:ubiquinone oxidoreductase subunit 6 (subunit J)
MKQPTIIKLRVFMTSVALFLLQLIVNAQDKVEIDTHEVSSWFQRNWTLVAGLILILLLMVIMGRRSKRRGKSTTVISDNLGNVKKVTTTEVKS